MVSHTLGAAGVCVRMGSKRVSCGYRKRSLWLMMQFFLNKTNTVCICCTVACCIDNKQKKSNITQPQPQVLVRVIVLVGITCHHQNNDHQRHEYYCLRRRLNTFSLFDGMNQPQGAQGKNGPREIYVIGKEGVSIQPRSKQ